MMMMMTMTRMSTWCASLSIASTSSNNCLASSLESPSLSVLMVQFIPILFLIITITITVTNYSNLFISILLRIATITITITNTNYSRLSVLIMEYILIIST